MVEQKKYRLNRRWKYLILLFIHLEEQTNSGKYKNIKQKYIKFISVCDVFIFS